MFHNLVALQLLLHFSFHIFMPIYCILFISNWTLHRGLGVQISHWVLTIRGGSIDELAESLWASRPPDRWSVFAHTANSSQPGLTIMVMVLLLLYFCHLLSTSLQMWQGYEGDQGLPLNCFAAFSLSACFAQAPTAATLMMVNEPILSFRRLPFL